MVRTWLSTDAEARNNRICGGGYKTKTGRRPKTHKRRPPQNRLEITLKWFERDYRPTQKQETTRFAVLNEFDQGLRFVHNPTKCTKTKSPSKSSRNHLKLVRTWLWTEAETRNSKICVYQQIWQGSSFCTFGRVMYKTNTLVKFENRKSCCFLLLRRSIIRNFKVISRNEQPGFAVLNEFDQGLRFVHNPTKSTKRRPLQNRLEITSTNVIVDRSRNEKQQDLRFSTNLTRVFVLYITLPKVQNEDPFKIVSKSLQNGSNVILRRSRNKEQQDLKQDLWLSRNFSTASVLYFTRLKVQIKSSWNYSKVGPNSILY